MAAVLVTGTNKGVGLEFCRRYAARGDQVLGCCRDPDTADDLRAIGDNVEVLGVRVGDGASVAELAEIIGTRGHLRCPGWFHESFFG
ncbi:MAG: SDR family NAD(P)-dependent oxidoreductase [Pseudomonadales bacterium]|nr:SDR family NAD(P)-dependent oxidoreductase [Pseudomonadales bacterium]MDP6473227.1 SDR family NAD(P)-dependent oxidoreductase [Pseudomonadales bacterium]MDP6826012.1 SDR family NAD(P)-dependent oxidoreductase [Pseudomonadales bacterium]MDP6971658.1 SDR family NAD(P)-dependent oxidoreductase [Pseudomonadales bacterium]